MLYPSYITYINVTKRIYFNIIYVLYRHNKFVFFGQNNNITYIFIIKYFKLYKNIIRMSSDTIIFLVMINHSDDNQCDLHNYEEK